MANDIRSTFSNNVSNYQEQFYRYSQKHNFYSTIRVLSFLLFAALFIYFIGERELAYAGLLSLFFSIVFIVLIKTHNKLRYKRDIANELKLINEEELMRLAGDSSELDGGMEFIDGQHPYTSDLDIFGENSLFQMLNHATTDHGKEAFASWFKDPASNDAILERQSSIREISSELHFRQLFEANGKHFRGKKNNTKTLMEWLLQNDEIKNNIVYKIAVVLLPIVAVSTILLYFRGQVSYFVPLVSLAVNSLVLKKLMLYTSDTVNKTNESLHAIGAYESLIYQIENKEFSSLLLKRLKSNFESSEVHASKEIGKLKSILIGLEARNNFIYLIFNVIFLPEIIYLIRIENWRARNKAFVGKWFDSISQLEALFSLGAFSYANPDLIFPALSNEPFQFEAENLGHPLIPPTERISNNFSINSKGAIAVITGSNMSGKSTFLRTIGINLVLALSGSVVAATKFHTSKFRLFTSMRTQDSLKENISSFYAELKRIQLLLEYVDDEPVFFFLDELLKGTNSKERQLGATSLIHQLSKTNALGIVSTHDIELASLADETTKVNNYSFNSHLDGDQLIFDYTLSKGACKSFNASILMKKIGIDVKN